MILKRFSIASPILDPDGQIMIEHDHGDWVLAQDAKEAIDILLEFVPYPENMSGWDDPDCPEDAARLIRIACTLREVPFPQWMK